MVTQTEREREKQRKQWWIDDPVHDNALARLVDIRLHAFCRCRIVLEPVVLRHGRKPAQEAG
jgi:hypothetical protein